MTCLNDKKNVKHKNEKFNNILLFLIILTAKMFLSSGSGITIRHNIQITHYTK
jgi:hypothetical protein